VATPPKVELDSVKPTAMKKLARRGRLTILGTVSQPAAIELKVTIGAPTAKRLKLGDEKVTFATAEGTAAAGEFELKTQRAKLNVRRAIRRTKLDSFKVKVGGTARGLGGKENFNRFFKLTR